MRYCSRCIIPDTRPNVVLDAQGVCNACRAHGGRPNIDWEKRRQNFAEVVKNAQRRSKGYDCLIPVSGGKDSTWQVLKCLEAGLNPLAVTWKTPARTALGTKNLENLISLGVDHVDYRVNPKVEKKFMYEALCRYGSTAIPMHMALFNIPLTVAVRFEIPLVVWGENSAFEYGGTDDEIHGFKLDGRWLQKYGITHGTTAGDWVSPQLTKKELTPYFGPDERELEKAGVLAVFLGYYFSWDPEETYRAAKAHGFSTDERGPRTGYYNYADIDDDFIAIHHWLKWYKFGFTRLFDNLSLEIRNQRMTREQAVVVLEKTGEQRPEEDIRKFCAFVGIAEKHFYECAERFRNKEVWVQDQGVWKIRDFIIPGWRW